MASRNTSSAAPTSGTTRSKQTQQISTIHGNLSLPADVAELLTPFLSPTSMPLGGSTTPMVASSNVFSPLTSPALVPNATTYGQWTQVSMPPPSPSITAEHIMRRQQQSSVGGDWQPPSLPTARARGQRGTSASPHHHPYRAPTQPTSRIFSSAFPSISSGVDNDDFLLDALHESPVLQSDVSSAATAAFIASLSNTPVLQFAGNGAVPAQLGIATELSGLHLPDAMAGTIQGGASHVEQHSRTLHQLNMSHAGAGLENESHGGAASLDQQMSAWLDQTSAPGPTSAPAMATPAMLMNLPVSAHHLPHTSSGEIITEVPCQEQVSEPVPYSFDVSASVFALATQSAPMVEFIHPPAPPLLRIGPAVSTGSATTGPSTAMNTHALLPSLGGSSGDAPKRGRRKSVSIASDLPNPVVSQTASVQARRGEASRARRRSRATQLLSPRTTPLVPSILKGAHSPGFSPSLAPLTPAIAPRSTLAPSTTTPTPSTTPHMRPRPMVAATSTTNIVGLEADVVTRLATKSNYQNIMEGNSELLGLTYRSEFKSGLERRRTNHKNAEQKRRDSLKMCFQNLRNRIPDVDPKLVSKIYLLRRANAHIDALALVNKRLIEAVQALGGDAESVVERAMVEAAELQSLDPCLSDGPDMDFDT
ncbi:hypothetical protein EV180_005114 [Coemansia sp. RSA 518]|nr:hypothetical protein GGH15_002815 [Coemansia sp. RSA 562]KAJ2220116.1 hypothetical protein EV180_005114 [Coemansia sp. RSA 518]KAJ2278597.1 hypothetical protein GGH14_002976 [Coemansia sp. RSA 370]KAJ2434704.1 hypothetical protein IWW41_001318 [Coemansia sp. RSA 2522]